MPRPIRTSKKTAKPASSMPGINKSQVEKYLAKVPEESVFRCDDGCLLRDLEDLKNALAAMSDQTFAYHSNEIKNDFSRWVREVVGDEKLAKDLAKASNREQAARIAEERYLFLKSQPG